MGTRASSSNFNERFRLLVNGASVKTSYPNKLALKEENIVSLVSLDDTLMDADLFIDDLLLQTKLRLRDMPGPIEWIWLRKEHQNRAVFRLQVSEDEFWFEIKHLASSTSEVDPHRIVEELSKLNLSFAYSRFSTEVSESQVDWFAHMETHWREMEPILEMISKAPHHILSKRRVKKPIQSVDSLDPEVIRSIVKEVQGAVRVEGGRTANLSEALRTLPIRVTATEKFPDHDVTENRLLKFHLESISKQLEDLVEIATARDYLIRDAMRRSEGGLTVDLAKDFLANNEMIDEIGKLTKSIEARRNSPGMAFLTQISPQLPPSVSQIFKSHPHYSRFYDRLTHFLDSKPATLIWVGQPSYETLKPNELYSRWCMYWILEALMEMGLQVKDENVTRIVNNEVKVELEGGEFTLEGGGLRVKIFFEKLYEYELPYGSYTTPKKAAITLEIFSGDIVPRIIVFEPKFSQVYSEEEFTKVDIDRLHVFHDSIVDLRTEDRSGIVIGCYLLHPTGVEI